MPNFVELNNITIRSIRRFRSNARIESARDARRRKVVRFFERKFGLCRFHGYNISNAANLTWDNKVGWAATALILKDVKPFTTYAGYKIYRLQDLNLELAKVIGKLVGDLTIDSLLFFQVHHVT